MTPSRLSSETSRPRVRPYVSFVDEREGTVLLHGPNLFLRIVDEPGQPVSKLLPLMDGTRTLAQLCEATKATPAAMDEILRVLRFHNVVDDAAADEDLAAPPEAAERTASQRALFSAFTPRPTAAQNQLAAARLLLIGAGAVGAAAAAALVLAGVGRIDVLDGRSYRPSDGPSPWLTVKASPRSEALVWALEGRATETELRALPAPTSDLRGLTRPYLSSLIPQYRHVLVALEEPNSTLLARVNEAATASGVLFTPAVLRGHEAIVGPTVIPNSGPCWRCYDLRAKGMEAALEAQLVWESHREARPDAGGTERPMLPTFPLVAGAALAQEAIASLSGFITPSLRGFAAVTNLLSGETRLHRVLKIPRCPACGNREIPDIDRYRIDPLVTR